MSKATFTFASVRGRRAASARLTDAYCASAAQRGQRIHCPIGPSSVYVRKWYDTITGDVINVTDQEHGPVQKLETTTNGNWKSPPSHFTNSSKISPGHPSGLVPGLIAAGIFIMFLLCLYAILWKCMVSPPHKGGAAYS
ncbi:unnamed protein product [Ranitomeya imitator]|uniref:Uncharacterized protein n=1 Tax=Ranitomeya imitator TaxID=111125 RepID=A0ABN9LJE6_9NEOB|nr:unnamed protein product [Ranitomeya imitator]